MSENLIISLYFGFSIFMFYKFMNIAYDEKITNWWQEALTYIIGYILWIFVVNFINIESFVPILTVMGIFALTLNYKSNLKKRVIMTISVFLLMNLVMVASNFIFLYLEYIGMYFSSTDSLRVQMSIQIVALCVLLSIATYKKIRVNTKVPISYWNILFAIPIIMVLILVVTLFIELPGAIVAYLFLFLSIINIIVFGIFDKFLKSLLGNIQTKQIEVQNLYYSEQLKIMEMSLKSTKIFEHDIANHISCLFEMISNESYTEVKSYLASMLKNVTSNKHYITSGVSSVDSVLNFKISQARALGIIVRTCVTIPENLNISSFDIVAILGNLLDNAIEGAKADKWIDMKIEYIKGRLMIEIKNSFDDEIKQWDGITSNVDTKNHGFGLQSIIQCIEKYNGTMEVKIDERIFHTKILMYITEKL